jgi:hypothetical protein
MNTPESYEPIRELLDRVRARWRTIRLFRAAVRAGLAASAVLIVALIAAPWAGRSPLALAWLAAAALLLALGAIAWAFAPLRHRPSNARLARFIEEHAPSLDDRLVTAVDVVDPDRGRPPPALAGPMLADAATRARDISLDSILPIEALRRSGFQAAAAVLLLVVVAVIASGPVREAWDSAWLVLLPSRVVLEVRPGDARLQVGMPLSIQARLVGNRAPVAARVEIAAGDRWRSVAMSGDPAAGYRLTLESITAPFAYRVAAGALTSRTFTVTVARAPRVTRIDLDYTYPPALGLKPRSEQDSGDIYGPSGTEVRIRVHTDREVASGHMTLNDEKTLPLTSQSPTLWSTTLTIVGDNAYRVALADGEGLSNPGDSEYFIRMLEDRPPEVHITRPAGDRSVTRLEEVDIEAQADDDHGIERFELVYAVRGGTEIAVPLDVPRGATSITARRTLYLEDLDVQPGDFVSYYVRARDITRGNRSSETRSDIFFLEVRPFEQEFVLAESQSMSGSGYTGALDELVNAERQVIVATWKLDRRAKEPRGGRSDQDIRSVGRTQAALKLRVEQTASSFRESTLRDPRRRAPSAPATAHSRPEEDAMSAAAEAMGQAVSSLDALSVGEALSPEMRALNDLLRAQADVKRRQLSLDQSAAGAAGNNNRNYDISTLFDRELRRQQQTSYETPRSGQTGPRSDSSALDAIKDLARRQDELLRRQQNVVRAQTSPEELKRELEQLTREQSELRQLAGELERQMSGQQSNASSRPSSGENPRSGPSGQRDSGGGSESENSRQMRAISEDMQQAASDLRRGLSPGSGAGTSGSRALEKLRELEKRLQSSGPDEPRRALGDMQLEAGQLADGQRQVASELSRLTQGDASTDAMRRLAGDEERLADRARRLQAGLRQQAGAEAGPEHPGAQKSQTAVADAARELARLVERMQQSADELRAAGGGPGANTGADRNPASQNPRPQASAQQDIARLLDRVADRLGPAAGARDGEARKLSRQLARTEELRQKLDQVSRALESAARTNGRAADGASTEKAKGESGRTGEGRQGAGGSDMSVLREESLRQLREARSLLDDLQRQDPGFSKSGAGFTPEGQGMILSAPGTEGFKQDFSRWESLTRQATLALEQAESRLSKRIRANDSKSRLAAGVEDTVPREYQKQVDSYFKAIAAGNRR